MAYGDETTLGIVGTVCVDKEDGILLPHNCDDWIIGTADDARRMIADLEVAIKVFESDGTLDAVYVDEEK